MMTAAAMTGRSSHIGVTLRRPRSAVSTMARMTRLRIHTLAPTQNGVFPRGISRRGGASADRLRAGAAQRHRQQARHRHPRCPHTRRHRNGLNPNSGITKVRNYPGNLAIPMAALRLAVERGLEMQEALAE